MHRRNFLASVLGASVAAAPRRHDWWRGVWPGAGDDARRAASTLRARAAAKGLTYGSAGAHGPLQADQAYGAVLARECGILTPEAELKLATLRPTFAGFNFAPGDWMQQWAASNNLQFRGHTLVFWQSKPGWFDHEVTPDKARGFFENHIQTVCAHYAGKVTSWDVVNEPIFPGDGLPGGLRNSMWMKLLGPGHIADAFHLARAADPNALLVINDWGFEYANDYGDQRRADMLALLRQLLADHVPVQALGLQTHLYSGMTPKYNPDVYRRFLGDVADLGLKIMITEMDVQDLAMPGDLAARDAQVAAAYTQVLSVALANPAVIAVETWGLSNKYSYLQQHAPRADGLEERPLPLDDNFQPTLAYEAIGRAFDAAPPRAA